jgi:putative nucleotidyltransferase with HDIG domain
MARGCIVVVTERDNIRDLFQGPISRSSRIKVVSSITEVHKILNVEKVHGVISDFRVSLVFGAEVLKWVHKKTPWIPLILLVERESVQSSDLAQIRQYAHVIPLPISHDGAAKMIEFIESSQGVQADDEELDEDELIEADADREIVTSIVECIDNLPTLPTVVRRMQEMMQREDTSVKEIGEVIALDVALAARVLKLVNSALYGLASPVTTIDHAVALLGFAEVKNLTMSLKVMDVFADWESGVLDKEEFWKHSLACALCARNLGTEVQDVMPEEAFLGGLLHDIGKLVMDSYFQDQWKKIQKGAKEKKTDPLVLEKELLGIPHTEVGEYLARHWQLSEIHQMAIRYHHVLPPEKTTDAPLFRYCAVITCADQLVRWMCLGSSGYAPLGPIKEDVWKHLNIHEVKLEEILRNTLRELRTWESTLGLGPTQAFGQKGEGEPHEESVGGGLTRKRVWVISSKSSQIPPLHALISSYGYSVITSHWEQKILSLCSDVPHDATVLDVRMSKIDEGKFTKFLKAFRSRTKAPVLVLTNSRSNGSAELQKMRIHFYSGQPHMGLISRWLGSSIS